MRIPSLGTAIAAAIAAVVLAWSSPVLAEFPERPIEFVCAHKSNSTAKWCAMMAKLTGEAMDAEVKVLYLPEERGRQAAQYVLGRPADGHTWLQYKPTSPIISVDSFGPDPDAFRMLVTVEKLVFVIGTAADSGYDTFADLVEAMKARPGGITIAANGVGSPHHIQLERLFGALDLDWRLLPEESSGKAMEAAMHGEAAAAIAPPRHWAKAVAKGDARLLLVVNEEPIDKGDLAGVPVPNAFGADYDLQHQKQGILVRSGTPPEAARQIKAAFRAAMLTEEYRAYLADHAQAVAAFDDDDEENTRWFQAISQEIRELRGNAGLTN